MSFSSSTTHPPTRYLHQPQAWNLLFYTSMEHLKLCKSNRVCQPKQPALFLLALGILSRNYKTKKILTLPCTHRCIFSLTLKLITTLLQKLAMFYIWNIKRKDDGMKQNTLHCFYDACVATNQHT